MAASHYDTLGVVDGAPPDEVRRAYLDLARRLHPDRWIDAGSAERQAAERRMQEVNEAWRVLGNPGRRLAYDAARRRDERPPVAAGVVRPFPSGDLFVDEAPADAVTRVVRALPWAALLLVLFAIFVFTAYATADRDTARSCIRPEGGAASPVPCEADGARPVEARVSDVGQCPAGTEAFQPAGGAQALCLG